MDALVSRPSTKEFNENFDRIFGVKKKERYVPPPLPDWGSEQDEKRMDIIGSNGNIGYEDVE
jgi:NADPH-dependent 2,4-dienoyl-CoA reductase/sulfur reductase-like enzyme